MGPSQHIRMAIPVEMMGCAGIVIDPETSVRKYQ